MGFPPPPPPNGPQPPPDQGGGFGPPQGFGPPPPPPGGGYGYPEQGGGYGYPGQGGGYGYPQQGGGYGRPQPGGGYGPPAPPGPPMPGGGYGGYGGYPAPGGYPPPGAPGGYPPPPPPPNNGKRNAWIVIGSIVATGAVVAGIVLVSGGGDKGAENSADAKPSASRPAVSSSVAPIPSFTVPSDDPTLDLPTDEPSEPASTPTQKLVPYVVLSPGQCFDAPTLTRTVDKVTTRPCDAAHDAQVVANETLSGTFTSDVEIQNKALALCEADARKHLPADGRTYYPYALFPKLITYQVQHRKTVTCSLTRNNGTNGVKLHSRLG